MDYHKIRKDLGLSVTTDGYQTLLIFINNFLVGLPSSEYYFSTDDIKLFCYQTDIPFNKFAIETSGCQFCNALTFLKLCEFMEKKAIQEDEDKLLSVLIALVKFIEIVKFRSFNSMIEQCIFFTTKINQKLDSYKIEGNFEEFDLGFDREIELIIIKDSDSFTTHQIIAAYHSLSSYNNLRTKFVEYVDKYTNMTKTIDKLDIANGLRLILEEFLKQAVPVSIDRNGHDIAMNGKTSLDVIAKKQLLSYYFDLNKIDTDIKEMTHDVIHHFDKYHNRVSKHEDLVQEEELTFTFGIVASIINFIISQKQQN